jgi:hypothetical protein
MAEPVLLDLHELQAALGRVLDAARARLGDRVALEHDHYWNLPVDSAFDMSREPADFTVGQLSDDLSTMTSSRVLEPVTAWHDLAHLIGLLRALELRSRK